MATLERIRRRSGLLIIVIGIAMLGFILTDLLGSGNSIFRGDVSVVGRVNGRTVEYQEFSDLMDQREQQIRQQNPQQAQFITRKQIADGVWDEVLREELLGEQYDDMGFVVTSSELAERIKQNPNIRTAPAFKDEITGEFSEGKLQQYITNLNDNRELNEQTIQAYDQWIEFEDGIRNLTLQDKYNQAIQKGIYMPAGLAKEAYIRRTVQSNANFIVKEYSTVTDSSVTIPESAYKTFYQEHMEEFKTDRLVDIQYVNFPINASTADRKEIIDELNTFMVPEIINTNGVNDTFPSFAMAEEDSLYAAQRSDLRVTDEYYKKEELPTGIDSTIFDQELGFVEGPYEVDGYYYLSKLADKKMIPDSVKARHILLSFREVERGGNPDRSFQEARVLADSLVKVLRADTTNFSQLAITLSDDKGSGANGGDLGWFDDKQMVAPFSKFCFRKDVGAVGMVLSQFGIHIIEVLDQAGGTEAVKLYDIAREIQPGDETLDSIYGMASQFAASVNDLNEFGAKAEEKGYQPRPVTGLKPFDENVIGLGNNREIVRWAHNEETEIGDIQLFSNGSESYIVVVVSDATDEGYRPLEMVKEAITPRVVNHIKAQQFIEEFNKAKESASDLQTIAGSLGLTVNTQTVNFGATNLAQYGNEPKVVGVMTGIEVNKTSNPIEGERGVYMVQVISRSEAEELPSYKDEQIQQAQTMRSRVGTQVFNSIKENAKIDDRRANFY